MRLRPTLFIDPRKVREMLNFLKSVADLGYTLTQHFGWVVLIVAGLFAAASVAYMGLVWFRGKNANYNQHDCDYWPDDEKTGAKGKERGIKVDLAKALMRKETWPKLMLPLFVVATVMAVFQLTHMSLATWSLMATLWFVTTPLRTIVQLAVARRAWHNRNYGRRLGTTLGQDVDNYYRLAWGMYREPEGRKEFQPLFQYKGFGKAFNFVHKALYNVKALRYVAPYLKFIILSWGYLCVLLQAAVSWLAWPVAAFASPFYHLDEAEDFAKYKQPYHDPWWRNDHDGRYNINVVDSEVVKTGPATDTDGQPATSVVVRPPAADPSGGAAVPNN